MVAMAGSKKAAGLRKLVKPSVDRMSYLARAIDRLTRLNSPTHPNPEMNHYANCPTQIYDPARAGDTTD
jgi:hypothetical protein